MLSAQAPLYSTHTSATPPKHLHLPYHVWLSMQLDVRVKECEECAVEG